MSAPAPAPPGWRPVVSAEHLIITFALFWALAGNGPFISAVQQGQPLSAAGTWGSGLALLGLLTGAHIAVVAVLALLTPGRALKLLLGLLSLAAASAGYYMHAYGVVVDPSMMRNVLHTNPAEANELLTWAWACTCCCTAACPCCCCGACSCGAEPGCRPACSAWAWCWPGRRCLQAA